LTPLTLTTNFSLITVLLRKHETIIQEPENTEAHDSSNSNCLGKHGLEHWIWL